LDQISLLEPRVTQPLALFCSNEGYESDVDSLGERYLIFLDSLKFTSREAKARAMVLLNQLRLRWFKRLRMRLRQDLLSVLKDIEDYYERIYFAL
jgi:hypothetical protein